MHQCIKFILFWNDALHVSGALFVHHQQFKTVHTAIRYCWLLASKQPAVSVWQLYGQSWTADDGRKERPKHVECHSKLKQIWNNGVSYWFYYRNDITMHGWPYERQKKAKSFYTGDHKIYSVYQCYTAAILTRTCKILPELDTWSSSNYKENINTTYKPTLYEPKIHTSHISTTLWGRYVSYWADSLMMALVTCRNM